MAQIMIKKRSEITRGEAPKEGARTQTLRKPYGRIVLNATCSAHRDVTGSVAEMC